MAVSSMMTVLYNTFIAVGIILLLITLNSNSVAGMITGYSFVSSGILLFISYLMNNIYNKSSNNMENLLATFYTIGPFCILLAISIYSIYLLTKYKHRISKGNVAPGYTNFTNISIVLFLVQLYIFYLGTQKQTFKDTSRLDKVYSMILFFVGILNIISVVTISIILALFTTDG